MRYMILVYPGPYGANDLPDPAQAREMQKFNQELVDAGVLRGMDGLEAPDTGARVRFDTGKAVVVDGPFTEAREVVGGYWLLEVASREEAIGWAKRAPMSPKETLEVRKVHDYEAWPDELKQAIEGFEDLRARGEARR